MNPRERGPFFQARERVLTLCPALGSPRGWWTIMMLAGGLPWKPEAGVTCFIGRWQEPSESVFAFGFAICLPSGKLPSGHSSPHPPQAHPHWSRNIAQRLEDGKPKVLPWQAEETECHCLLFNQIKEELCLLIKQPCMDNSGRLEKHLIG